MATELKLEGAQADYTLQTVPTPDGAQVILVGASAATQGDVHELKGIQTLLFADGKVDLFLSSLAQPQSHQQTPNQPNTSITQRLVQWVESSDEAAEDGPSIEVETVNADSVLATDTLRSSAPSDLKHDFESHLHRSPEPALPRTNGDADISDISATPIGTDLPVIAKGNTNQADVTEDDKFPNNADGTTTPPSADTSTPNTSTPAVQNKSNGVSAPAASSVATDFAKNPDGAVSDLFELGPAPPSNLALNDSLEPSTNPPTSETELKVNLNAITGTSGPDKLMGGAGKNTIDGRANFDLEDGAFYEQLLGGSSDDVIYYRGFWGDLPADQAPILALLAGGDGNDHLHVSLDNVSTVGIDGGSGTNKLILTPEPGQSSPWDPSYIRWDWVEGESSPLLSAQYTNPSLPSAGLLELNASLQQIAAGAGTTLNLVRPGALNDTQLMGTNMSDWLLATPNTSTIKAGNGNDFVIAKEGNTVHLGQGINTLFADSANITLSYEDAIYGVRVNLQNKTGLVIDDEQGLYSLDRLMTAPNKVIGSAHNDVMVGNEQNNTFTIGGGIDQVWGGGGKNTYIIQSNPLTDRVYINDFDFSSDQLMFDLQSFDLALGRNHKGIEIRNQVDELVFQDAASTAEEESALLKLMLDHESGWIHWTNNDASNEFIFIGSHDQESPNNTTTNFDLIEIKEQI